MRNRMTFAFAVGLASLTVLIVPMDAIAGRVHAKTWITWRQAPYAFCDKSDVDYGYYGWGNVECSRSASSAYAYAHEWWEDTSPCSPSTPCLNNWHNAKNYKKYIAWAGAWHTGSYPRGSSEASSTGCCDSVPFSPPIPGDSATAESFRIRYMDAAEDSFDINIDSASFLQVYLDDVDPGDSTAVEWKLSINEEVSRVRLVGYALPGGGDSVVPSMDGRFAGLPFTLTPYPNRVHVLSFGPIHFTAAGNVAESDLLISSGDEPLPSGQIPTLTEWGMIIFCVMLFGWMAWVIVRRRRRVTIGV
ncbi:MAG TPA: hypothetical protein VN285_09485 [Candidatus Deferrimicrobium sp.]|nr:hypothetical protein [Candidatus Deferrimicrobium sp.]